MRVDHLVIVTFPRKGPKIDLETVTFPKQGPKLDPETVQGAEALYMKYIGRTEHAPLSARIIQVWDDKWRKKAPDLTPLADGSATGDQLTKGQPIDETVAASDNVGVYIICHGYGNKPVVFGGQGSSRRLDDISQDDLAGAMVGLLRGLGLKKVRKLCLLKCGTIVNVEKDPNFLIAMANALVKNLDSPPMVAAWDDYVSVVGDVNSENWGKKLVHDKDTLASANP